MDLVLCAAGRQSIDFDAMANPDWASHDRFSQEPPGPGVPANADQRQHGPLVTGSTRSLPFCSPESRLVLATNRWNHASL
jgi:hypothetical protein